MSDSDITFSIDLDTSEAERKLSQLDEQMGSAFEPRDSEMPMADAAFERMTGGSTVKDVSEVPNRLSSFYDKFARTVQDMPGRFSKSVESAVNNWKDIFKSLKIGQPDYGERRSGGSSEPTLVGDSEKTLVGDSERTLVGSEEPTFLEEPEVIEYNEEDQPLETGIYFGPTKDADLSDFGADDLKSKWSQEGSDAYTKFSLMQERAAARKDMRDYLKEGDEDSARSAAERFARADGALHSERKNRGLKEEGGKQGEITDETKKQNEEYLEQLSRLGKIFGLLKMIKEVINAVGKLGKAVFNVTAEQFGNQLKAYGSLTRDINGAGRAFTERTAEVNLAGIRAYGRNSPISEGAYLGGLQHVADKSQAAMTGNVDSEYAIAANAISRATNGDFNVIKLLTGDPTRTTAQTFDEMANAFERMLMSRDFWNKSQIEKEQLVQYARTLFGNDEIVNGIMFHVQQRLATGSDTTLMDSYKEVGGHRIVNDDSMVNTSEISTAFAELKTAAEQVKNTITDTFKPTILDVIHWLERLALWLNRFLGGFSEEEKEARIKREKEAEEYENAFPADRAHNARQAMAMAIEAVSGTNAEGQEFTNYQSDHTAKLNKKKFDLNEKLHTADSDLTFEDTYLLGLYSMKHPGGDEWINIFGEQNAAKIALNGIKPFLEVPRPYYEGGGYRYEKKDVDVLKRTIPIAGEIMEMIYTAYDKGEFERNGITKEDLNKMTGEQLINALIGTNTGMKYKTLFQDNGQFDFNMENPEDMPKRLSEMLGERYVGYMMSILSMINGSSSGIFQGMEVRKDDLGQFTLNVRITNAESGRESEISRPIRIGTVNDIGEAAFNAAE